MTTTPQHVYLACYNREKKEITAPSAYAAVQAAEAHFKVPKSKRGLLSVHLLSIDNKPVTTTLTN